MVKYISNNHLPNSLNGFFGKMYDIHVLILPECQFSAADHAKFSHRLEEGYDLLDPKYEEWLQVYGHQDSKSS